MEVLGRVQFIRAIKSALVPSSGVRVELAIVSEFCDPIPGLAAEYYFRFTFTLLYDSSQYVPDIQEKVKNDVFTVNFEAPPFCGKFSLKIEALRKVADAAGSLALILPLHLECIEVEPASASAFPLLTCQRKFSSPFGDIVIEEEYGRTMGSHIFDSSIVLLHFLAHCPFANLETAVELGSGCGLIGIWLSMSFSKVLATDKHLDTLKTNIVRNGCEGNCIAMELDWSNSRHIAAAKAICSEPIDLIIAGDVLYDLSSVGSFFDLVGELATPGKTKIIVAQKLRAQTSEHTRFDISTVPRFVAEKVMEEAQVVVWSLEACGSTIVDETRCSEIDRLQSTSSTSDNPLG